MWIPAGSQMNEKRRPDVSVRAFFISGQQNQAHPASQINTAEILMCDHLSNYALEFWWQEMKTRRRAACFSDSDSRDKLGSAELIPASCFFKAGSPFSNLKFQISRAACRLLCSWTSEPNGIMSHNPLGSAKLIPTRSLPFPLRSWILPAGRCMNPIFFAQSTPSPRRKCFISLVTLLQFFTLH